jgi:hypothetical protein
MRRVLVFAAVVGAGVIVARTLKLHERLMAYCEGIFERMPDTFPPKKMLRGIEETRAETTRILELLEAHRGKNDLVAEPSTSDEVHGAV